MNTFHRWHRVTAAWTVAVVAIAMRTIPTALDGAVRDRLQNDDGVYYFSAIALSHGLIPFRDFTFVHPPGIILILTPFAALGSWLGDANGFFIAREFGVVLGGANAALVSLILWPRSKAAAWAGGLLYAVWGTSAQSEITITQVTVLNFLFLLSVLTITRWPRQLFVAGVLIGAASATKIWAAVFLVVMVPYIVVRFGRQASARFVAGVVAAGGIICLPFFLSAPAKAWSMVFASQFSRPTTGPTTAQRLHAFYDGHVSRDFDKVSVLVVVALLLAAGWPAIRVVMRRIPLRQAGDAPWLSVLVGLQVIMLMAAPILYNHYTAFIAPGVCLLWGGVVSLVARHRTAVVAATAALAIPASLTLTAVNYRHRPPELLREAVAGQPCVWSLHASTLIMANAATRSLENGCDIDIDAFGTRMYTTYRADDAAWQARVRRQMSSVDVLIDGGFEHWYLNEDNRRYVRWCFPDATPFPPGDNILIRRRTALSSETHPQYCP